MNDQKDEVKIPDEFLINFFFEYYSEGFFLKLLNNKMISVYLSIF